MPPSVKTHQKKKKSPAKPKTQKRDAKGKSQPNTPHKRKSQTTPVKLKNTNKVKVKSSPQKTPEKSKGKLVTKPSSKKVTPKKATQDKKKSVTSPKKKILLTPKKTKDKLATSSKKLKVQSQKKRMVNMKAKQKESPKKGAKAVQTSGAKIGCKKKNMAASNRSANRNKNASPSKLSSIKHEVTQTQTSGQPACYKIICFSCNTLISNKMIRYHLLFGHMKCGNCSLEVSTCTDFANICCTLTEKTWNVKRVLSYNLHCAKSPTAIHEPLKWDGCVSFLSYHIERNLMMSNICRNLPAVPLQSEIDHKLSNYMERLSELKEADPWKSAFEEYKTYCNQIDRNIQSKEVISNKLASVDMQETLKIKEEAPEGGATQVETLINLKDLKFSEIIPKGTERSPKAEEATEMTQKRKDPEKHNVHGVPKKQKVQETPSSSVTRKSLPFAPVNNHYLVIDYPRQRCPEECPECYSAFYSSGVTVNCSSLVMTVKCENCGLDIFILPDM